MPSTAAAVTLAVGLTMAATTPIAALEPAFGNTITTTYPNGKVTKLWLHRDGTYDAERSTGQRTAGEWKVKDGKLCITQKRPFYVPLAFCTEIVKGKVGTTWKAKGLKGEPVVNTIVAGAPRFRETGAP